MKSLALFLLAVADIIFLGTLTGASDLRCIEDDVSPDEVVRDLFFGKDPPNDPVDDGSHTTRNNENGTLETQQTNDGYSAFGFYYHPVTGYYYPLTDSVYDPTAPPNYSESSYGNRLQPDGGYEPNAPVPHYYSGNSYGYGSDPYSYPYPYSGAPTSYEHNSSVYRLPDLSEVPPLTKDPPTSSHQIYAEKEDPVGQTKTADITPSKAKKKSGKSSKGKPGKDSVEGPTSSTKGLKFSARMRLASKRFKKSALLSQAAFFGRGRINSGAVMWVATESGHIYFRATANNIFLAKLGRPLKAGQNTIPSFSKLVKEFAPSWAIWIDLSGKLKSKGEYPYDILVIRNGVDAPMTLDNAGPFEDGDKLIFIPKAHENLLSNMGELVKKDDWVRSIREEYNNYQIFDLDTIFGVVAMQRKKGADQGQKVQKQPHETKAISKKEIATLEPKLEQKICLKTFSWLVNACFKFGIMTGTKPISAEHNDLLYGDIGDDLHLQFSPRSMTLYKGKLNPHAVKLFSGKEDQFPFDWAVILDRDGTVREFGKVGEHNIAFYSLSHGSNDPIKLGQKTDLKNGDIIIAISTSLGEEVLAKLCGFIGGHQGRRDHTFKRQIQGILRENDDYIFGALSVSKSEK